MSTGPGATARSARSARPSLRPFVLWLAAFYACWLALVLTGDRWALARAHWPIAVAMSLGSYVAGSTPMGGGTIGFPILVLLFDQPASVGRGFSFAVQSIGMTSASIFVLSRRQPLAWGLLGPALLGSLVGTPLGLLLLAPRVPDVWVKLVFAAVWASFGLMTLVKVREMAGYQGVWRPPLGAERALGLGIGLFGGACVAALTGVGIDMLIYTALVLVCRCDLKVAIPTSVVLMAWTSLVGVGAGQLLCALDPLRYPIDREVFGNWLAAAPIVALGAPLGAFVVERVGRVPTLLFVAVLCLLQLPWTAWDAGLSPAQLAWAAGGVLAANAGFHLVYALSPARRADASSAETPGRAQAHQHPG